MWPVFFDMDGVTSDFAHGVMRSHDRFIPKKDTTWEFGLQIGIGPWSDQEAWKCMRSEAWWANLLPCHDGMALVIKLAKELGEERLVPLSDAHCLGAPEGKRTWLRKHLGDGYAKRAVFSSYKWMAGGPAKVLIDDYGPNIDGDPTRKRPGWTDVGGFGILLPRPWNRRKPETDEQGDFNVDKLVGEVLDVL